jgi:degradative hydroxymethylglutaryl-CoA reductase
MVENCVGVLSLPLGVAPNFVINGRRLVIPMCVEEPSVIAAASGAAKLVAEAGGGFRAEATRSLMVGQVQLLDVADLQAATRRIEAEKGALIELANTQFCAKMHARGGGVVSLEVRTVAPRGADSARRRPYLVVHIELDVQEAMGANLINTVTEGLAPSLERASGGRAALRILSNLCPARRAKASFRLPVEQLSWKGVEGATVATRLLEAFHFAQDDAFRATTHNKGIMNGVDAVALATGQDWRAVEAAAHAWAATRDGGGGYGPLTRYWLEAGASGGGALCGELDMPIAVGVVGGALHSHPIYRLTLELMGRPTAAELAQAMVCVGLAQNFAALRALAVEGIQRGHMALHARNVAVAAGVSEELVPSAVAFMTAQGQVSREKAEEFLRVRAAGKL